MCFLPCFGVQDVYLEEPRKKIVKKKEKELIVVYDPKANSWVKLTGVNGPQLQPVQPVQPVLSQPISYPQPTYANNPYPYASYPQYKTYPNTTDYIQQPTMGIYGHTASEIQAQQLAQAQKLEMNKKQEMKPADDDPLRMYWVRELDNTWTQRNRLTIDSGDIGEVRWYAIDGVFYAVRLAGS